MALDDQSRADPRLYNFSAADDAEFTARIYVEFTT